MKQLLAMVLLVFSGASAYAHNGLEHVMGTVARMSGTSLEVRTTAGKSTTVTVDSNTRWMRGTAPIAAKDVHAGDRVVIHAKPVDGKLQAVEIAVGSGSAK